VADLSPNERTSGHGIGLGYAKGFVHRYRNRRQLGQSVRHAIKSARVRMQNYR